MLVNGTLEIELGIDADDICVWWGDGSQGPLTTHTYKQAGVYNIRVRAKNITFLDVSDCFLQTLDVQQAVDLTTLLCSMNNLRCLQLAGLTKLRILDCYNNHLEVLDLRDNPALLKVNCRQNELKTLHIRECRRLRDLDCSRNQLKSLPVTMHPSVLFVKCNHNCMSNLYLDFFVNGLYWRSYDLPSEGHLEIGNNPGSAEVRSYKFHGWVYDDRE